MAFPCVLYVMEGVAEILQRRPAQPGLGGAADGLPDWVDELDGVPRTVAGMPYRADRLK